MGTKFILGQEDGTVAGGNARGTNAVDLQTSRTANTQVASGNNSVVCGGANNSALGVGDFVGGGANNSTSVNLDNYKTIVGGAGNTITGGAGHSFIGGGQLNNINIGSGTGASTISGGRSNSVTSQYSTVSGGYLNTVSSSYSTVLGGESNTASTNTHATVVGGSTNTASGQYSVAGGYVCTASGTGAVAFGGGATATGTYSLATGINTFASGSFSQSFGLWTEAYLYGQTARSSGRFNSQSDAQNSLLTARREATLTTGGTTVLSLDGTGITNLIIPSATNRMWNVQVRWVAVVTTITGTATGVTVGDTKSQNIEIGFKKVGGVSSLVGAGVFSTAQQDASMASASLIPTAGASQQLALTFTAPTFAGGGSVTCRVVAKVELVEVAY
tara:strand:+ start:342 stop:1505 length:1164 start_codon:yes stop_codon:yes gene_type:complete